MFFSTKAQNQKNVYGQELEVCSMDPVTGWFRDGYCNTNEYDIGIHTVCGTMTEEFLEYTKNQGNTFLSLRKVISRKIDKFANFSGNDLSTPRGSFPGLKPGNRWALCAPRWLEAYRAGKAPLVRLNATNIKSLQVIRLTELEEYDDKFFL